MVNYFTGKLPTLLLHVWLAAGSIDNALDILRTFYTESRPPKRLVPREQEKGVETQVSLERAQLRELEDRLYQEMADRKRAEDDLKMYEKKLTETRNKKAEEIAEIETNYETKLEELRVTNSSTEAKLRETEARNEDLISETNDLKQTNASLMERLHELERTLVHERSSSKDKDEVIKRQQEEMQQQKEKHREGMKKLRLPPGLSESCLTKILEDSEGLEELLMTSPSDSTGQWARLLPSSLKKLDVFGPGETGEPVRLVRQLEHGLEVVMQQAGDDVINQLAKELGPRITSLAMFNRPRVTAGALQRLLSSLSQQPELGAVGAVAAAHQPLGWRGLIGLEDVTLGRSPSGAFTDASLAALHGCSQLRVLQLGDSVYQCTDIPVSAVSRLAVTCRKLEMLILHATEELNQEVRYALVQTDLGESDDGTPRTLTFNVLAPVY
ncbi:plectin-like isoform X4 [Amphibalanus amphitrite]|uniref:plectin-like isoform X4 n=1 Tax=Amphibalanus amphitrite TaxID=1232801 RepID=UPI001C92863D|nr:plectin-like isoform X4 [Amphibalanus amphitrite]